jgi:hypothetical protein
MWHAWEMCTYIQGIGERPEGKSCVDGRIIIKWIYSKWDKKA